MGAALRKGTAALGYLKTRGVARTPRGERLLRAFKEVEDNLVHLRLLGDQTQAQDEAVGSARRAARLSLIQYREGSVSHLNVIDADRSVLQQQRVAVQLDAERARATVNLIRAMGGGWSLAAAE